MATPHQPHHLHHIPIKAAARKLPIKRKNPEPDPNPNPNFFVKPETPSSSSDPLVAEDDDGEEGEEDLKPPPFKFHRIWQESDEIRFLQGLLDSSAHGLVFPRDLNPFFDRFSKSMAQPYTRSQLSEKLRRLKKKFRVISARLDRGLDAALLTPHDRALLHLSKQLWHPAFAASSPFSSSGKKKSGRVTVRVTADYPPSSPPRLNPPSPPEAKPGISVSSPTPPPPPCTNGGHSFNGEGGFSPIHGGGGLGRGVAKAVMDVFDQCLQEVHVALEHGGILYDQAAAPGSDQGKARDLARKWQEQRVAELDVLASRLRERIIGIFLDGSKAKPTDATKVKQLKRQQSTMQRCTRAWNLKQEKIKHLCSDGEDCPDHQASMILISFSVQEEVEEGLKACSLQVESMNE